MANAFYPTAVTQTIAASTTSAGGAMNNPENGDGFRMRNAAAADGFYKTGVGAQTATSADIPFVANSVEVFRKHPTHTHIAVILASGTGNVYITVGEGQQMATTNQLVIKAKLILSRRNDTVIDATIINELGLAQERLEREAFLPKFLYANAVISATAAEVDLESALARFLGLCDEAGGVKYRVNDTASLEPYKKLRRYDDLEQLLQRFPGTLASGGVARGYFLVDRLLTLRPSPSAPVPQDLQIHFYQGELNLPAVGNSTIWTQKASDYLLGEAGMIIAQSLRDKQAFDIFKGIKSEDHARIYKKDSAEGEADLDRSMGDED